MNNIKVDKELVKIAKNLIADEIAPIDNHYQRELQNKDKQIKSLEMQLKTLRAKTNQYNLDMQGLNAFDMVLLRKHKKLIKKAAVHMYISPYAMLTSNKVDFRANKTTRDGGVI